MGQSTIDAPRMCAPTPCGAGGMAGGFFATNLGATSVAGVEGWRCAFHFIAALSVVTAALVAWLVRMPTMGRSGKRIPHCRS